MRPLISASSVELGVLVTLFSAVSLLTRDWARATDHVQICCRETTDSIGVTFRGSDDSKATVSVGDIF